MASATGNRLRVAVLSSASGGGAGIAAKRITDALTDSGRAQADFIDIASVGERLPVDSAIPKNLTNGRLTNTHYTIEYPGFMRGWFVELLCQYDVVNVHWASYLVGLAELNEVSRRGIPMLFTLHDYYYVTGGCHYPAGCDGNRSGCLGCPQVDHRECDAGIVPQNLRIKRKIFSRPNVHLAAPSEFLVGEAIKSGVVPTDRTHVLRNAYRPLDAVRPSRVGPSKRVALVADTLGERRKGMPMAIDALAEANRRHVVNGGEKPFSVDVIGQPTVTLEKRLIASGLDYELRGRISDHRKLVEIYAASDILLTCAYEDNWPNVLVEAGCYGCVPVVGPGHGAEEFVKVFSAGFVAKNYSVAAFADALTDVVSLEDSAGLCDFSRNVAALHQPERVADAYMTAMGAIGRHNA